jgi:purine catabolism regulator
MIGISVRDALELPALRGAELVGGAAGIDRIIQSINIMEVPDVGSYVKPAELLLTTAYPIRDDKNAQERLVPELWEKGLAGLAIKPQRYISEIPELMIRQADELGFPLIRLPIDAAFTEIINPLLMEILNRQAVILQRNEQISQALAGIMLRGGGLDEIVRALAGFLALPVSIHDASLRRMASWLNPRDFGVELNKLLRESVADWRRLSTVFRARKESDHFLFDGVCGAVVRPVVVAGEIYAYVFSLAFLPAFESQPSCSP